VGGRHRLVVVALMVVAKQFVASVLQFRQTVLGTGRFRVVGVAAPYRRAVGTIDLWHARSDREPEHSPAIGWVVVLAHRW
jgi:hypothetical protein